MIRLVAELYYTRDIRQPEIAALTGFSVSKVSRLLAQARELGIVRISIEPPHDASPELVREVETRFGVALEITPGREADPRAAARLCGVAAAERIVAYLPTSGALGLAGGYTMDAVISALPRVERPDLRIIPVVGGWDPRNPYLDTNELVRRMGERLGASVRFLHAPGMLDSATTKAALLQDSGIEATTRYWDDLDVALLGVSGGPLMHPGYGTVMDRLDERGRRHLAELKVVGDIAGHLLREDGTVVDDDWSRRTISIGLDALRRVPRVIVVAAGSNKVPAVLASLRSGLVHVMVTDLPTIEAALRAAGTAAVPARAG